MPESLPKFVYITFFITAFCIFSAQSQWQTLIGNEQEWLVYNAPLQSYHDSLQDVFVDSNWVSTSQPFGFGYENIKQPIDSTFSCRALCKFWISDLSLYDQLVLSADYDDAFIAHLNGIRVAFSNVSDISSAPNSKREATSVRKAVSPQGYSPEYFEFFINELSRFLRKGENTLSIEILNSRKSAHNLFGLFTLHARKKGGELKDPTDDFEPPLVFQGSTLPVFHISTNLKDIPDDPKVSATLSITPPNTNTGHHHLDEEIKPKSCQIRIEKRGSSSQKRFPKKSYGFETIDALGNNLNVPLLGLPKENDWILYGPYGDKSLLRNHLAYTLSRSLGQYAPRTRFCELLIDNKYQGVYLLMEKIKPDKARVNIKSSNRNPVSTGYIIKIDKTTGSGGEGWHSSFYYENGKEVFIQYAYPKSKNLSSAQKTYIQSFFHDFESAVANLQSMDASSVYEAHIDSKSFIDFFILNELAYNIDGYRLSTFMHKPAGVETKLKMGPIWDFNASFGNSYDCDQQNIQGFIFDYNLICDRPKSRQIPFWWQMLLQNESFKNSLEDSWQVYRNGPLHLDSIYRTIDEAVDQLQEAQVRNFSKWRIIEQKVWPNHQHTTSYEEEIAMIKTWTANRIEWLDDNLLNGNVFNPTDQRNIQKYPLLDKNDIVYYLANYLVLAVEISNKVTNQTVGQLDLGWKCPGIHRLDIGSFNLESGEYRVVFVDENSVPTVQIDIMVE